MGPDDRVVSCIVQVANNDHTGEWIAAGIFGGLILAVFICVLFFFWRDSRNIERDRELDHLRKVVKAGGMVAAGVL